MAFLLNDELLVEGFMKSNKLQRETVSVFGTVGALLNNLEASSDVLVVSDQFFDDEGLCEFTEALKNRKPNIRKFLLMTNHHNPTLNEAILKESLASGWLVIRPGHSITAIIEQLSSHIFGLSDSKHVQPMNNTIQFIGSTPNIGTTIAAFGVAAHLSMRTDRSVAFICLNLKSSKIHRYLGVDHPPHTLESLRADLKSMSLSSERLRRNAWRIRDQSNLDIIFGNMPREQAEFYSLNDINCLLQVAARTYDYCIVDTNAYWDNAATIGAMMSAGMRIMVTTGQLGHFQEDMNRWLRTLAPVFGRSHKSFDLLITQKAINHSTDSYSLRDIRRETEMLRIGEIRKCKEIDSLLNQGKLWEAVSLPGFLSNDMSQVASTLLNLFGENTIHRKVPRGWFRAVREWFTQSVRRIGFDS